MQIDMNKNEKASR